MRNNRLLKFPRFILTLSLPVLFWITGSICMAVPIQVIYTDSPGEGFNDPQLGAKRKDAFEYALSVWSSTLKGNIPVTIKASFDSMGGSSDSAIIASTSPQYVLHDFSGAPLAQTWYPSPLADQFADKNLKPTGEVDAEIAFNSDIDSAAVLGDMSYYYEVDPNPRFDIDFITVTLHEIGHVFGFYDMIDPYTGKWFDDIPDIYGRQLEENGVGALDKLSDLQRFFATTSDKVYWKGPNTVARYDFDERKMYAPMQYYSGSSIAHWNMMDVLNDWDNHPFNFLLEPYYCLPHRKLDLTREAMADIGWSLQPEPVPQFAFPQIDRLSPSGGSDWYGQTLDVNGDKMITVYGYLNPNARIFKRVSGKWQFDEDLTCPEKVESASIDGNRAILQAGQNLYVYAMEGTWNYKKTLPVSSSGEVHFRGNTLIAGNRIYQLNSEINITRSWALPTTYGSAAIDGDTIVVTSSTLSMPDALRGGGAFVYRHKGDNWVYEANLWANPTSGGEFFGSSVAIDGDTIVVGADFAHYKDTRSHGCIYYVSGSAYVFQRSNDKWTQQARLAPLNACAGAGIGHAVAIEGDIIAIGAPGAQEIPARHDSGSCFVYLRDGSNWKEVERPVVPHNAARRDSFGWCVGISSSTVAVTREWGEIFLYQKTPRGADLTVSSLSISPSYPGDQQEVTAKFRVTNKGTSQSGTSLYSVKRGSNVVGEGTILNLASGATSELFSVPPRQIICREKCDHRDGRLAPETGRNKIHKQRNIHHGHGFPESYREVGRIPLRKISRRGHFQSSIKGWDACAIAT